MNYNKQKKTPLLTAIKKYIDSNPIPFDVPGHKMGRIKNDLSKLVGTKVFQLDVNAPIGIDNLYLGTGVIEKSEQLMAEAYNADKAIFLINGTTSGILTMIMGCLNSGDKIILPRNVHKSVINSLIVSGAIPIFIESDYDYENGISNGITNKTIITTMDANPDAKGVFVINPTYFGICSDLKTIVDEAHKRNMIVMVDEAHGAHLHFSQELPISAMDAGADISSLSMHKTCGSLTQSSVLLIKGKRIDYNRIRKTYSMFGSTSPSHILLASLDAARKTMALKGEKILKSNLLLAKYAREKINQIPGLSVLDKGYCQNNSGRFDFDETRLVIKVDGLQMSGFQVYHEIRKDFNIQLELAETYLVLAILSIGSTKNDVDKLIGALSTMSKKHYQKGKKHRLPNIKIDYADIAISPRQAFFSHNETININLAEGKISCESVMIYPPGIPIVIPGEKITKNIIKIYNFYIKSKGKIMSDSQIGYIKVVNQEDN